MIITDLNFIRNTSTINMSESELSDFKKNLIETNNCADKTVHMSLYKKLYIASSCIYFGIFLLALIIKAIPIFTIGSTELTILYMWYSFLSIILNPLMLVYLVIGLIIDIVFFILKTTSKKNIETS